MAREARRGGVGTWVLWGLALAAMVGAATGLAQAYGVEWPLLAGERAPGGTFGNRNFLAHLMAIGLPVVLLVTLEAPRPIRWAGVAGIAMLAAIIVLTRSRAAWLAGLASWGIMGLALVRAGRRGAMPRPLHRLIPALGAVGIGVAAAVVLPNRLAWRAEAPYATSLRGLVNYQEGSGRGRMIQYRNSLELARQDPVLGTGPGNWMVHYPRVTTPGDPSYAGADPLPTNPWPSSDWVAFWTERGLFGALLLLGALLAAGLTAWRRLGDATQALRAVTLLGLLTASLVAGLFDAVLLLAAPTLFVAAALGALLPETGRVISMPLEGRRRAGAMALVLLAALGVTASSAGQLAALRLTAETRDRAVLQRALRWDPGSHRLHLMLSFRGTCAQRLPHARAAARLLPHHERPRRTLRACGRRVTVTE
jgi:O-antigen ligase